MKTIIGFLQFGCTFFAILACGSLGYELLDDAFGAILGLFAGIYVAYLVASGETAKEREQELLDLLKEKENNHEDN